MREKLKEFFAVPANIRQEFWQDTVQKNRLSLIVISIMIFGMELFNMARVLFLSNAGLGTWNNRIYFSMYCILFLSAAVYLLLQYVLRNSGEKLQWRLQIAAVAFFFLWHIGLNAYDLVRDPEGETYIFVTAVVGLAMFIQMPWLCGTVYFGAGYGLFMLLNAPVLEEGVIINLTITTIVALAISYTRSRHAVIELSQRKEIRRMNTRLEQLLQRDPLTGILNKRAFENCAVCAFQEGSGEKLALFMLDLDDFKTVNDRYGHPCGDYVLKETAERLAEFFSDAVCVGRVGGDEFAALIPGNDSAEELQARGEKFIRLFSEVNWQGESIRVSCSAGMILAGGGTLSYEEIYKKADEALYEAKRSGKGCCCLKED